jgi:hypothetical protein
LVTDSLKPRTLSSHLNDFCKSVANCLAEGKSVCAKGSDLILVGHERLSACKPNSRGEDHGGQMMNGGRKVCPAIDGHITESELRGVKET